MLLLLGNSWIHFFFILLELLVNNSSDWVLDWLPWLGNQPRRRRILNSNQFLNQPCVNCCLWMVKDTYLGVLSLLFSGKFCWRFIILSYIFCVNFLKTAEDNHSWVLFISQTPSTDHLSKILASIYTPC